MSRVQVQCVAERNGLVDANISWPPPTEPGDEYMYYLVLRDVLQRAVVLSTNAVSVNLFTTSSISCHFPSLLYQTRVVVQGFNSSAIYSLEVSLPSLYGRYQLISLSLWM